MDLLDWKDELPETCQIYAIIDPLAENEPLKYWYQHADSTDAWPLYAGTEYGDDVLSGPWLLPLAQLPSWSSWWQEQEENEQATGFLLASEVPPERLVQHWKSLMKAGLDGEEVLFRFYDPRVLGPMLFTFTEDETRRFLGPTDEILVWHEGEWVTASPYPESDMTEHPEPWWRMQEPHFVGQPGKKERLIDALDDFLWQHNKTLMQQWYQKNDDLKKTISVHISAMYQTDIPELFQPVWLFLQLFDYSPWWPSIVKQITQDSSDEQVELMRRTVAVIQNYRTREFYDE